MSNVFWRRRTFCLEENRMGIRDAPTLEDWLF